MKDNGTLLVWTVEQRLIVGQLAQILTDAEDGTPIQWAELVPAALRLKEAAKRAGAL